MFDSYGFEILVQPALYLAAVISLFVILLRGSSRERSVTDEGVKARGPLRLAAGARRRTVIGFIAAALILPALVITPPGHRAAIYNLGGGVSPTERPEGLSFVLPWVQSARMVSVRTQVYEVEVYPQSLDLQEVTVPVAVNFHVDPSEAAELYQEVGLLYAQTVIAPAVLQLLTQEVGQFAAIDFAQNRAALAEAVHGALGERLTTYGIIVESVNVKDAVFAPAFIQSVEAKIIADQKASEALRLVQVAVAEAQAVRERAAGDRDAAIAKAEGERQAVEQVAAALGFTPAEYLEWVQLTKWDGKLPSTLLGDAGDFAIILDPPVAAE
jgi:regulator of protease activity HflC (stomatin/prohibitin superfamily)